MLKKRILFKNNDNSHSINLAASVEPNLSVDIKAVKHGSIKVSR